MHASRLLVGASIPTGVEALRQFQQLKLGEIALCTLPDDAAEAQAVARFCRENRIYFMVGELMRRGSAERWHCPNLTRADFDQVIAEAGEYYLGRYTIGEAGGIMYWPQEYTIGRAVGNYVNLPPASDVRDAHDKYVQYLKHYIDYERAEVGAGRLLNVDSSMLFHYQAEAGLDDLCLEMFPGDPNRMLPAIRGCARAWDKFWGVHIAIGCYGGFEFDDLWLKRWRQSLYLCHLAGAEFIFPESGYYGFKYGKMVFDFHHPVMQAARRHLREYYRFTRIHTRPERGPETRLAIAFGQEDGCPGLWNPYAWGQYEQGDEWKNGPAEKSWDLTRVLTTRENPYSEVYLGAHSFSGHPPCGQYDIVPVAAGLETLRHYQSLVFLGYNLMDQAQYETLIAYVEAGGELLMWLPHCTTDPRRGAPVRLFRDGDLSTLFGVKVVGRLPTAVRGVKALPNGTLPLPGRGLRRDPVMMGDLTPARLEFTSANAVLCAGFTGHHAVTEDDMLASPALVEHALGKGMARLVTAFEYPGDDGMRPFAEHLLRIVSLAAQDDIRLLAADSVTSAVYQRADGVAVIYALNTEFDVSQNVRVWRPDGISAEYAVAPSSLAVFYLAGDLLLHPSGPESDVYPEEGPAGVKAFRVPGLADQTVACHNFGAGAVRVRLNGQDVEVPPHSAVAAPCRRLVLPGREEFYAADYLEEPWVDVKNTRLPY